MTRDALFAIAAVLALVGTVLTGAAAAADSAGNGTVEVTAGTGRIRRAHVPANIYQRLRRPV
jgi:hypothetical protein